MKTTSLFLVLFSFLFFSINAQTSETLTTEKSIEITEFGISTDNWKELKNFDWASFKELTEMSKPDTQINLSAQCSNEFKKGSLTIKHDFKKVVEGKISNIDQLIKEIELAIAEADDYYVANFIDK